MISGNQFADGLSERREPEPALEVTDRVADVSGFVFLLVEDEESVLKAMAEFLRRKGVQVVEMTTCQAAIDYLEAGHPANLVLSDVETPGGVDGFGLVEWIKANRPSVCIVLTSGRRMNDDPSVPFMPKPYSLKSLIPLIEGYRTAVTTGGNT